MSTFSAEVEQGDTLPSYSSHFFAPLCFLLIVLLYKMALNHSTKVLSGVPKLRKAEMYHLEKILVFGKLHTGVEFQQLI